MSDDTEEPVVYFAGVALAERDAAVHASRVACEPDRVAKSGSGDELWRVYDPRVVCERSDGQRYVVNRETMEIVPPAAGKER